MKKLFLLGFFTSVLLFSCSKDKDETTTVADFTATVTGEAPNAQIAITNSSTGATSYSWTFGEGASISSSTDENPSSITVDKVGDLTIKLVVKNGSEEKELTKKVTITGNNAIITYTDIEFAQNNDDVNYGRFFSTSEGKMYKQSEINSTNGSLIDLVYKGGQSSFIFFETPDDLFDDTFEIPNATTTKVKNYDSGFEVSVFDSMTDDENIKDLEIINDHSSIGSLDFPLIVLFENAAGKKGAIKLKAINSDRLLVDIKIQKY